MIKEKAQEMIRQLVPRNTKIASYQAITILFYIIAVLGYFYDTFKIIGILYVTIVTFALFAGLNSLDE